MRKATWRSKSLLLTLAVLVALVVPLAAYADNKTPLTLTCSVMLAVTDPGTLSMKKGEMHTKREQTTETIDCDVDALDGTISTTHDSDVTVDDFGNIAGQLEGSFSLATSNGPLKGKLEASISGVVIGWAIPGVVPIHSVTDTGKWQITGGVQGLKGEGSLSITLVGIVGIPAAGGGLTTLPGAPGSLQGEVKVKD